jgi:hypothetical protein
MDKSEVVDRAGNRWVVRRRWTPRWTRVDVGKRFRKFHRRGTEAPKQRSSRWWDFIDIPVDFDGIVVVLAIVALVLLLWFAVIPLLLIVVDVLVVVVVFLAGLLARLFLRRPWTIVATRIDGVEITRQAIGWRASRDAITTLRHEIELGLVSPVPSFEPP